MVSEFMDEGKTMSCDLVDDPLGTVSVIRQPSQRPNNRIQIYMDTLSLPLQCLYLFLFPFFCSLSFQRGIHVFSVYK